MNTQIDAKIANFPTIPLFQQDLSLSVADSLASSELTWGSMNDGSAFLFMFKVELECIDSVEML